MGGREAAGALGALRRLALAALLALVAAPAAVAAPLAVHASFDESIVPFGDVIHTRITVVADPSVRVSSVRVSDDLAPLTITSSAHTSHAGAVVEVTRTAMCATAPCVGAAFPKLPPVVVTATLRDGRAVRATAHWPQLQVRGRVDAGDLARARPPFRVSLEPPAPSYAVGPSALSWLLIAVAIASGVAAVALALGEVRRRRRRRAVVPAGDPLLRALRLAREAESRPPPDRRRAAGLLARLLANARLAEAASDLAWSPPEPEPKALEELASEVESS